MKIFIVFLVFVASVYSSTNVQRCIANFGPLPRNITIEGCTSPPCNLQQLGNAVIHMSFVAPHKIWGMRTLATAYLGNLTLPYSLGAAENTCNFLTNTRCPVNRGATVNYTLRFFIESFIPVGTSTTVEFRVVDHSNKAVVCVRVPIRIVRS